ncbi:msr9396 (plasmid) [Mesorhizobium japonicum MAFF 303099]|uniref:Msr9396 protein n=1 Tax=Mesorhizobium japonicum (strain LMG 29417 / CECT 9101 / MAFF 303099) TaxID=266835 RepID=Q982I4_RHILO|nr:msr9396 [Mesorhizobium japonicum MAFF 303099]
MKGPLTGISGAGSGHGFPFRHSVEAMEMELKCGAFLAGWDEEIAEG